MMRTPLSSLLVLLLSGSAWGQTPEPTQTDDVKQPEAPVVEVKATEAPATAPTTVEEDDEPALPAGMAGLSDDEPALPAGMGGDDDEPALPAGMGGDDDEPALPAGMGDDAGDDFGFDDDEGLPIELHGFLDIRNGSRLEDVPHAKRTSMQEARLQLDVSGEWEWYSFKLVGDAIYDPVLDVHDVDLYKGDGFIDLRKAYITLSPWDFMNLKIGRQAMTWGTGDLVFINDLFPKDWTAFMIGRDMEYLKAPSDAARLSVYSEWANLDVAYTPRFNPDRYPDRRRLMSYDPILGRTAGSDAVPDEDRPDEWFSDGEVAARLTGRLGAYDLALYGYKGFWKSPMGFEMAAPHMPSGELNDRLSFGGQVTFPELSVYGASVQGPLLGGIVSVEGGYYQSADDAKDDLLTHNNQVRGLLGFEREVVRDLSMGVQYYAEWMQDYSDYEASFDGFMQQMGGMMSQLRPDQMPLDMPAMEKADEVRHVLTTRLRYMAMQQSLEWSLFAFYSPSDKDAFLMPSVKYKVNDQWTASAGANVLTGADEHTFFGQLEENSNVWSAVRYAW